MKKVILTLSILYALVMQAQIQGFNYKAMIRENGSPLANQALVMMLTVWDSNNNMVYQETHNVTTDNNGLVVLSLGEGQASYGNFDQIDWSIPGYVLQVEMDRGNGLEVLGVSPLKAVPVAKYAERAGNTFSGNYNDLNNKPVIFYKTGTTESPTHINDNIYTFGKIQIGISDTTSTNGFLHIDESLPNTNDISRMVYTKFGGNGDGLINAFQVYSIHSGNGTHRGLTVNLEGAGNGVKMGTYISIPRGNGHFYGHYVWLQGTGTGVHEGARFELSGEGSGNHYGVYNMLRGSGSGTQFGVVNQIENSGNSGHFGTMNLLSGGGTGDHCGSYNVLSGQGNGEQIGSVNGITNSGTGTHFGSKNLLYGTGPGEKYASYNVIDSTAGGKHYAVYAEATKDSADVYAGYFKGNVMVRNGKLLGPESGNADTRVYVYGTVSASGGVLSNGSSDGYTLTKYNTGEYEIVFDTSFGSYDQYIVVATLRYGEIGFISTDKYANKFYIKTFNTSGTAEDKPFDFIVIRK